MNDQLYIDALLDGLQTPRDDLATARRICGFPETEGRFGPLTSILGEIGRAGKGKQFAPGALSLAEESVFASGAVEDNAAAWRDETRRALDRLQAAFKNDPDNPAYRYTLYHFLHAYGARVAYGGEGEARDASWFDRNRVLAAVASCLDCNDGQAEFLLLKGAVSGIQKFIYHNIGAEQMSDAEKVSKRLRGRSFLVAFINQVIAEYLCEQLELEQANLLFAGGGHFTLLLPNRDDLVQKLEQTLETINLGLLKNVGPQLSLLAVWEACGSDIGAAFARYYRFLGEKLEAQKQKRYRSYLAEAFSHFEEIDEKVDSGHRKQEEELGRLAPYARFILEVNGDEEALRQLKKKATDQKLGPALSSLNFLGKHFYIVKDEVVDQEDTDALRTDLTAFLETYKQELESCGFLKIIALNDPDLSRNMETFNASGLEIAYGFRFVGNYAPVYEDRSQFDPPAQNGNVMFFEDLAKLLPGEEQEPGLTFEQLGVLRLDVDDLGTIFRHGLGKLSTMSMERLLCLSREFQLFFGGYFNELARKHHIYITYSGGDDAFVVGSWLNTLLFVEELERKFRRFTCGNEYLNFSAGLFVCHPHYPIPRLARDSEDLLDDQAKTFAPEGELVKNALHVFNHTLAWEDFGQMMEEERTIDSLLPAGEVAEGGKLRRSMLRRFLRIIQTSRTDTFERYRQIAALHGLLARHGYGEHELKGEHLDRLSGLIQRLLQKASDTTEAGQREFDHYTIPLHMALYKSRTKK